MSHAPILGLHEVCFGPQPITFLVDEKSTLNLTCQAWIRLAAIVRLFLRRLLQVGLAEFWVGIWVYTKDLYPPKDFGL